jgi:hypothetical protein
MNALKLGFLSCGGSGSISELFCIAEMRIMSKHFERWKQLAALASKEQDPAKLTELAHEINLVLTQKNTVPPSSHSGRSGVITTFRAIEQ